LSRKQWYYRNTQFFCTKRCWKTAQAKAAEEQKAKAGAESPEPGKPAAQPTGSTG
jgi:hypothetical protein